MLDLVWLVTESKWITLLNNQSLQEDKLNLQMGGIACILLYSNQLKLAFLSKNFYRDKDFLMCSLSKDAKHNPALQVAGA